VLSVANTAPSFGVRANINYGNSIFEDSNESILAIKLNSVTPSLSISAPKTEMCATETAEIPITLSATGGVITSYELLPLNAEAQGLVTVQKQPLIYLLSDLLKVLMEKQPLVLELVILVD
jgi:hypothetical protein